MKPLLTRQLAPLLVLALLFVSCRVQFVPDYSQELSKQIDATAKMVDNFYLTLLEKSKNNERTYDKFIDDYVAIEVELNSLLGKNKVRPLNQNSARICEIALQVWEKYKNEHKTDNKMSDGVAKLNRKYMNDIFFAMQVAEQGKKLAETVTP